MLSGHPGIRVSLADGSAGAGLSSVAELLPGTRTQKRVPLLLAVPDNGGSAQASLRHDAGPEFRCHHGDDSTRKYRRVRTECQLLANWRHVLFCDTGVPWQVCFRPERAFQKRIYAPCGCHDAEVRAPHPPCPQRLPFTRAAHVPVLFTCRSYLGWPRATSVAWRVLCKPRRRMSASCSLRGHLGTVHIGSSRR